MHSWDEYSGERICGPGNLCRTRPPLGRLEGELKTVLEAHMTRLVGHAPRATKFLREVRRLNVAGRAEIADEASR